MAKQPKSAPAEDTVASHSAEASSDKKFVHTKNLKLDGAYTPESKLTWHILKNPRAPGKGTHERFAKYFNSTTVAEYTAAGGTKGDLLWDVRSGYLSVEGLTLTGELKARAPKAPPQPKADKVARAPKAKKEKAAPAPVDSEVEQSVLEETLD